MKFVVAGVMLASDGSEGLIGASDPWSVLDALQG
jgi:hypothetical protein